MARQSNPEPPRILVSGADSPLGRMVLPHLRAEGVQLPLADPSASEVPQGVEAVLKLDGPTQSPDKPVSDVFAEGDTIVVHARPLPPVLGWASLRRDVANSREFALFLPPLDSRPRTGFGSVVRSAFRPILEPGELARFLRQRGWQDGQERILGRGQEANPFYRSVTRLTNIGFAAVILLGCWWLLLAIIAAIRLDSRGPAIFAQTRVGRFGIPFVCYKFRTMRTGTPHVATHEVAAVAVTRLGAFLRRSKLDELPQVWNLLRGELSLVGPRPCLPTQTALVEARLKAGVLDVLPGITGLAQIHGVDMSDPEWLATYDARYVAIQSLSVDWRIMIDTALGKGNQDRVRP